MIRFPENCKISELPRGHEDFEGEVTFIREPDNWTIKVTYSWFGKMICTDYKTDGFEVNPFEDLIYYLERPEQQCWRWTHQLDSGHEIIIERSSSAKAGRRSGYYELYVCVADTVEDCPIFQIEDEVSFESLLKVVQSAGTAIGNKLRESKVLQQTDWWAGTGGHFEMTAKDTDCAIPGLREITNNDYHDHVFIEPRVMLKFYDGEVSIYVPCREDLASPTTIDWNASYLESWEFGLNFCSRWGIHPSMDRLDVKIERCEDELVTLKKQRKIFNYILSKKQQKQFTDAVSKFAKMVPPMPEDTRTPEEKEQARRNQPYYGMGNPGGCCVPAGVRDDTTVGEVEDRGG